jgi:hypothetical protein
MADSSSSGLERLASALGPAAGRSPPPVERWNPAFCGDIDMRIAADGRWFYNGGVIARPALVKLFSSVLKREGDKHFLVTPVEKLGIVVEDAPFQAVEMATDGEGDSRMISFRTQVDDLVTVGLDNALRFELGDAEGVRPYVHVRRGLWARLTRTLSYDLLALGEVREHEGRSLFGVTAGSVFHPVAPAADIEGLA